MAETINAASVAMMPSGLVCFPPRVEVCFEVCFEVDLEGKRGHMLKSVFLGG